MSVFRFEFGAPFRSRAALLQRWAVLTPLGMSPRDGDVSDCAGQVQGAWRAQIEDVHRRAPNIANESRFLHMMNCRPAFCRVRPRTKTCNFWMCPFCYARRLMKFYKRWWAVLERLKTSFPNVPLCVAYGSRFDKIRREPGVDYLASLATAAPKIRAFRAPLRRLAKMIGQRPLDRRMGIQAMAHLYPILGTGSEIGLHNRVLFIGTRDEIYQHGEFRKWRVWPLTKQLAVVLAGAAFAKYPESWLRASPDRIADLALQRQDELRNMHWWHSYGLLHGVVLRPRTERQPAEQLVEPQPVSTTTPELTQEPIAEEIIHADIGDAQGSSPDNL